MKKVALLGTTYLLLGWMGLLAPSFSLANSQCYWTDEENQAICAPPFGHIIFDINLKKYFCSPGQCVTNSIGQFRCSGVPGGVAVTDSEGRALCLGGCQDPVESLCVIPTP